MGPLPDTLNFGQRMRRECRERFPRQRGLAIPTCITARAWRNFAYLVRGPYVSMTEAKRQQEGKNNSTLIARFMGPHVGPKNFVIWVFYISYTEPNFSRQGDDDFFKPNL